MSWRERLRGREWTLVLSIVAVVVAALAVGFTYSRLFRGMDLLDESFYVAVPYRWALGARPFVDEMNFLQIAGLFAYPFVKLYVSLTGGADALVLFMRHVYLLFAIGMATAVFLLLRTLVRWQYALLAAAVFVSYFAFELPQVSYNTLAAGFLTIGTAIGFWTVLHGRGVRYVAAAGVFHACAAIAYPTLVLAIPVYAVMLGVVRGRERRRALTAYLGAAAAVGAVAAALLASFGVGNVLHSLHYQFTDAQRIGQGGGVGKLHLVFSGAWRLIWSRAYLALAAAVIYVLYRSWPRARFLLLVFLPPALYLAGERDILRAAGFAILYALLAPYLFLFIDSGRRPLAARLLAWGFVPALWAGVITGVTSAAGYVNSAVGLWPAMMVSAALFILALESRRPPAGAPAAAAWMGLERTVPGLTAVSLAAVVAATIVFQFQFIPRFVPYSQLTRRVDFGPYSGIYVPPARYDLLRRLELTLRTHARPSDRLLVFNGLPAGYLMWPHRIATDTVWVTTTGDFPGVLPKWTWDYYRKQHIVPDVVIRLLRHGPLPPGTLEHGYCGGLPYTLVASERDYLVFRRPVWFTWRSLPASGAPSVSLAARAEAPARNKECAW